MIIHYLTKIIDSSLGSILPKYNLIGRIESTSHLWENQTQNPYSLSLQPSFG